MRLLQINNLTLPDNDAQDDLSISARSALARLRGGAFDQDGPAVIWEPSTLSRRALYIGTLAEIDQQIDALKAEVAKGQAIIRARMRDGRERLTFAKLTGLRLGARTQDYLCRQEVTITLQRDWPYWFDPNALQFFDTGLKFDNNLFFDSGYQTFTIPGDPPFVFALYNGGNVQGILESMTLETPGGGTLSNLELLNDTNFYRWRYAGDLIGESRLDVDFLAESVQENSSDAFGNVEVEAAQAGWMALEVGGNNIHVSGNYTLDDYAAAIAGWVGPYLVALWPLRETGGAVAEDFSIHNFDGVYSNVSVGSQSGPVVGEVAPRWTPGSNSKCSTYSAGLAAYQSVTELTLMAWCRVRAASVWSDGVARYIYALRADSTNNARLVKLATTNEFQFVYVANNVNKQVTAAISTTGWFHAALTVSKLADQVKAYVNGVQSGVTQTGLGTWAGALSSSNEVIGAQNTTPTDVWDGDIAYVTLASRALTPTEIAGIAAIRPPQIRLHWQHVDLYV